MTEKLPTINIKGKEYVQVKDRIIAFNENYPTGSITTDLVSSPDQKLIIIKAVVTPDVAKPERKFTGYSQAIHGGQGVNATAALENAETSAVGRALGMMGIGVLDSVASADEITKAQNKFKPEIKKEYPKNNITPEDLIDANSLKPCDRCGGQFNLINGKNGPFYSCSNFRKTGCKRTLRLEDAEMWLKPEAAIEHVFSDNAPLPTSEY